MRLNVRLVQVDVPCLNRHLAALGHGVSGIDRQVHQHLFNLPRVSPDRP